MGEVCLLVIKVIILQQLLSSSNTHNQESFVNKISTNTTVTPVIFCRHRAGVDITDTKDSVINNHFINNTCPFPAFAVHCKKIDL